MNNLHDAEVCESRYLQRWSSFVKYKSMSANKEIMLKHFFVLFIFLIALQIQASVDQGLKIRTEWVDELKSFLLDFESKNPKLLTHSERNLLAKSTVFDKAIARAPALAINEVQDELPDLIPLIISPLPKIEEVCEDPLVIEQNVEDVSRKTIQAVYESVNSTYDELKKDFLSSAFCEPDKVLNDPQEKLSPILFMELLEDMRFIVKTDAYLTREIKILRFKEFAKDYGISSETIKYGEGLLKTFEDNSAGRFEAMARLRGVMLQEMHKLSKTKPSYKAEVIKEELLKRKIFTQDADGYSQCPFVSQKAFEEALAGREAVLKTGHKNEITNPNVITIVDYSRPSNERRMFVIDIKSKKVLHNTWVAHGGGKDRSQEAGIDKLGSSPQTSNAAGSLLSSEGFYIAKAASTGGTYLNNVTLSGIDVNNKSMARRDLVVHGWRTPNQEYVDKTWVISSEKKRIPGIDIYKNFMEIDFKNTKEDLFDLTQEVSSAASARDRIDATDGCLGVPDTQMGHADRKGRHKSQLELLREDLPGTLMFNYTGPGKTKSQYLN